MQAQSLLVAVVAYRFNVDNVTIFLTSYQVKYFLDTLAKKSLCGRFVGFFAIASFQWST